MDDFDRWNEIKKKTSNEASREPNRFPQKGEVWMSVYGKNIGFEQNGSGESFSRPVLVVTKFNNQMFLTVPLSTKQKDLDFYFNFTDPRNQKVSAVLAQIKLLSIKRMKRKIYDLPSATLDEIHRKIQGFFINRNPAVKRGFSEP
ncbi:MAG: hypothetical protein RLY47_31 [Candidatus Parcubacteria bacterium]